MGDPWAKHESAPGGDVWPAGQGVQAVEDVAALYVSAGQGMHWPELVAPDRAP